jgi:adenosine deaminase
MGGAISPKFVWEALNKKGITRLAESYEDVVAAMTFVSGEQHGFYRFLDKFRLLNDIPWDEELVAASVKDVCAGLAAEKIDYCWMDLSVNKYLDHLRWSHQQAISFLHDCFEAERPGGVGIVLSLKYESTRASQRNCAKVLESVADKVVGIDLVGDEDYFNADFYEGILSDWRKAGKMVRAHVGESRSATNIIDSIVRLKVTNVAHGLKVVEHPWMMQEAIDHRVTFDLGITSNYLTDVWRDEHHHPIVDMLHGDMKVTIGTDDPVQCGSTLVGEFEKARRWFGLTDEQLSAVTETARANCARHWLGTPGSLD